MTTVEGASREWLRPAARAALERGWTEGVSRAGVPFAYTCPARRYPEQFFWDSCFHAIAWSHLDPSRARAELRTLVAAQRPDGFIGHTIFWRRPVRPTRIVGYNVLRRSDPMTWTIQAPLLGWAWAEVAARSPDEPAFGADALEPVGAYHRWIERERGDADGLIGILQPDETGLDSTPAYDAALGLRAHPRAGFLALVAFNRRRRYDYRRVVADGGFHATDVLMNTALALSWSRLGRLGHPEGAARASEITEAMVARLWDPERGIFLPEGPDGRRIPVSTWAGLAPLALEELPDDIGRRLVEEHLLDPARYWLPYPVPSTSAEEPAFVPGRLGRFIPRYWRGPTWLFSTVPILMGMQRLGYEDAARELVERTVELVRRSGFCEYYDPFTGRGLGAWPFATSTIVVDAVERVTGARLPTG